MNDTKRRLFVGVIQWAGVGIGALSAYLLTLDSPSAWDWFTVAKGAAAHAAAGLAALARFVGGEIVPAKEVKKPRLDPDFDSFQDWKPTVSVSKPPNPEPIPSPRVEAENAPQDAVQVVKEPSLFGYYPGRDFSQRSLDNLATCHPDLVKVATRALQLSAYDFTVIAGSRDVETQKALLMAGKSQTMNSRHLQTPSHAFDFMAIGPNGGTWEVEPYYREIVRAMKHAGNELSIPIVCGIDWKTLVDAGHIELDRAAYPDVMDVQLA